MSIHKKLFITLFLVFLLAKSAWAAFPTTGILDNFNDTEGPPMTGWTDYANGVKSNGTNALANVDAAPNVSVMTTTYGANAEAYVVITTRGSGSMQILVIDGSLNGYAVAKNTASNGYDIYRYDGGPSTEIGTGSHTWSDGDSIGIYVTTAGVVYTYYKTGAGEWMELNTPISDGTHTGKNYNIGLLINEDDTRLDNFGGGTATISAIKSINGLAKASIKSVNGISIINMKSFNGLQ